LGDYANTVVIKGVGYVLPPTIMAKVVRNNSAEAHVFVYRKKKKVQKYFSSNEYGVVTADGILETYAAAVKHAVLHEDPEIFTRVTTGPGAADDDSVRITPSKTNPDRCRMVFTYYKPDPCGNKIPEGRQQTLTSKNQEVDPLEYDRILSRARMTRNQGIRNLGDWGVSVGTHVLKMDPRIVFV
jgi:hypothetical protein